MWILLSKEVSKANETVATRDNRIPKLRQISHLKNLNSLLEDQDFCEAIKKEGFLH